MAVESTPDQVPSSSSPNTSATETEAVPQQTQPVSAAADAVELSETKPQFAELFEDFDGVYCNKKHCKYQADYVHRLKAKYFSKKTLYGGNIFDKEVVIDNEIIKSSRWPCTRSFADPVQSFEDHSKSSNSAAETSNNLSNRKYQCKRSSN